jgi:hypothetical protein
LEGQEEAEKERVMLTWVIDLQVVTCPLNNLSLARINPTVIGSKDTKEEDEEGEKAEEKEAEEEKLADEPAQEGAPAIAEGKVSS